MIHTLEFDSIELSFGETKILSGVYMRCQTGEIVGLLGRNGSGKSSLMKVVFGALSAEHKSVRINGESLTSDYLPHRKIAYLPQDNLIPSSITVGLAFRLFRIHLEKTINVFPQLKEFLHLKPHQLSGGYLRLVETLLILHAPSPFCILDEPFTGLMPVHVETLKNFIIQSKKEKGIIISDHMHRQVTEILDRLYLLANGRTYEIKQKQQLIELGYLSTL
jgi:ABC-type multidrug transport system ATPase subunit